MIIESRVETCNGRVIDFFVVSNNFARNIVGIKVVEDALCNPHKPARLHIHAKSRAISVRTLRNPGTIGASMPYGPLNKDEPPPDDLDSWSNNQKYRHLLGRLEKIAAQLNGATDEDKARRVSRLHGAGLRAERCPAEWEQCGSEENHGCIQSMEEDGKLVWRPGA